VPLAAGAVWLARELARTADVPVAVLEGYGRTPPPPPAIVVTTRGSVLDTPPGPVGAVVLPDLDGSLRRPTLDAAEDTLRLAVQVGAGPRTRAPGPCSRAARWSSSPASPSTTRSPRWSAGTRVVLARRGGDPGGLRFPP
jgi:hypothetical protein